MELKDKIIKAGLHIFSKYGYEKATVAMIVKKANSSKGGFYHHFKSKSDVLNEITNQYMNEIEKIADDVKTMRDKLYEYMDEYFDFSDKEL
mgnify:CR=1 FL=1